MLGCWGLLGNITFVVHHTTKFNLIFYSNFGNESFFFFLFFVLGYLIKIISFTGNKMNRWKKNYKMKWNERESNKIITYREQIVTAWMDPAVGIRWLDNVLPFNAELGIKWNTMLSHHTYIHIHSMWYRNETLHQSLLIFYKVTASWSISSNFNRKIRFGNV